MVSRLLFLRRMRRSSLLSITRSTGTCSSVVSSFYQLGVSTEVCNRLLALYDISTPTIIQEKCLPLVFNGRHVVANGETGSGKTLCFLLPILQRLLSYDESIERIPSPLGLIMVPTPDLAHQINDTFQQLSLQQFHSSVVYSNHRLLLKPTTRLVIATPTSLWQYDVKRIIKEAQIICYDEADILFVGGQEKESWNILKTISKLTYEDKQPRQLILTAATLPGKTPKSVGTLLRKRLPRDTVFVNTDATHQIVSSANVKFVRVDGKNESKFEQLLKELDCHNKDIINTLKENETSKVLIFCNTVSNVMDLYEKLTVGSNTIGTGNETSSIGNETFSAGNETSSSLNKTSSLILNNDKCTSSNVDTLSIERSEVSDTSNVWWTDRIGLLNKHIPPIERAAIIGRFNNDKLSVLLTTDLSSRGLDLPDITHVIMYDFPSSTVDFIHRAGRTARAGKSGQVIAFVSFNDEDIATAIENVLLNTNKQEGKEEEEKEEEEKKKEVMEEKVNDLSRLFSRNKMLRRKFKRQSLCMNVGHNN